VVTKAAGSSLLQNGPATILEADVDDIGALAGSCLDLLDRWPDRMPSTVDTRFTLEGMAYLTELVYLNRALDLNERAPQPSATGDPSAVLATSRHQVVRVVK